MTSTDPQPRNFGRPPRARSGVGRDKRGYTCVTHAGPQIRRAPIAASTPGGCLP